MGTKDLLNDLERQDQEKRKKQRLAEIAMQKKESEDRAFIQSFQSFYIKNTMKDLRRIQTNLKERYMVKYVQTHNRPQNIDVSGYIINIITNPGVDHPIKSVEITLIGIANGKLVSLTAEAKDKKRKTIKEKIEFQWSFENFMNLNIEDEILKVIREFFISSDK